jgi:hypothetical protein
MLGRAASTSFNMRSESSSDISPAVTISRMCFLCKLITVPATRRVLSKVWSEVTIASFSATAFLTCSSSHDSKNIQVQQNERERDMSLAISLDSASTTFSSDPFMKFISSKIWAIIMEGS